MIRIEKPAFVRGRMSVFNVGLLRFPWDPATIAYVPSFVFSDFALPEIDPFTWWRSRGDRYPVQLERSCLREMFR